MGGFQKVPTWEKLQSDGFALDVLQTRRLGTTLWEPWVVDALIEKDRKKLVPYFKEKAQANKLPMDALARLLEVGKSSVLRKSFKALASPFSSHRGAKPKIPSDKYSDALKIAELLRPVIVKVLAIPQTTRTLAEAVQYLQKDHPEACGFLLRHINRFQLALKDPGLTRRVKKRTAARARLLADAMAGAEYDLAFSTSVERVRQARRASLRNSL